MGLASLPFSCLKLGVEGLEDQAWAGGATWVGVGMEEQKYPQERPASQDLVELSDASEAASLCTSHSANNYHRMV